MVVLSCLLLPLLASAQHAPDAEASREVAVEAEARPPRPVREPWGPWVASVRLTTVGGREYGARSLPGTQLGVRLGPRVHRVLAVETEGFVSAAAGPARWYGFSGWGTREPKKRTPGSAQSWTRSSYPTMGGFGLTVAGRLGMAFVREEGPRPVPLDVMLRGGVRGVWTRKVVDLVDEESIDDPSFRGAVVLELELRGALSDTLDLGFAGTFQGMIVPVVDDLTHRGSVTPGLSLALVWSPGRAEQP